jgi:hypothetical protein
VRQYFPFRPELFEARQISSTANPASILPVTLHPVEQRRFQLGYREFGFIERKTIATAILPEITSISVQAQ